MAWEYKIESEKVEWLAEHFPAKLRTSLRGALTRAMLRFHDVFQRRSLTGRPGLNRRTGDLLRSFKRGVSKPNTQIDAMETWLASRSGYAGIHEKGGTVKPKRSKYLAIPLPDALTRAGALKGRYIGNVSGQTRPSLYGVQGLFCYKSKRGNLLLAETRGKRGRLVNLFVLKKSVKIPARLRFFQTFRQWVQKPRYQRFFREAIAAAFEKAKKR